ncbi:MAG: hypothetical protein ACYTEQ_19395 [Planctomycetota bacterium]
MWERMSLKHISPGSAKFESFDHARDRARNPDFKCSKADIGAWSTPNTPTRRMMNGGKGGGV